MAHSKNNLTIHVVLLGFLVVACAQKSGVKYATLDQYTLLERKNRELESVIQSMNRQIEMMQSKLSLVKVAEDVRGIPASIAVPPSPSVAKAEPTLALQEPSTIKFTNEDLKRRAAGEDRAAESMYNTGVLHFAKGQHAKAVSIMNEFLTKHPKSALTPMAMMKLGASYKELGKIKLAKNMFEKTITLFPNTLEAKDAQDELSLLKGETP